MQPKEKEMISMGTKIGAILGGVVFIIFGLIPGFYFGSYTVLIISSRLFGGPLKATLFVKLLTAMGAILGIFCVASVCLVIGALVGTGIGYAVTYFSKSSEETKKISKDPYFKEADLWVRESL